MSTLVQTFSQVTPSLTAFDLKISPEEKNSSLTSYPKHSKTIPVTREEVPSSTEARSKLTASHGAKQVCATFPVAGFRGRALPWQVSPPDFLCYEASQSDGLGQHDHRWPQEFFGAKNHADDGETKLICFAMYMVYMYLYTN